MKLMEEKILSEGKVYPGGVLKVGSFLNHNLDCGFLLEVAKEIASLYKDSGITKVLTVESSGIAIAVLVGAVMNVPALFAKKHKTTNLSGEVYSSVVHSYTHNTDYTIVAEKQFLNKEDTVLLVDDFLAEGNAVLGLLDICKQAGVSVAGAAIAIEKSFQSGGKKLREAGLRVESMAQIESMDSNIIKFRP